MTVGYILDHNLIDLGLAPVVIVIVEYLKPRVGKRYVPLLPFPVSAALVSLSVIVDANGWPGWGAFLPRVMLETLEVAFAAMGMYKIYWTTILGR